MTLTVYLRYSFRYLQISGPHISSATVNVTNLHFCNEHIGNLFIKVTYEAKSSTGLGPGLGLARAFVRTTTQFIFCWPLMHSVSLWRGSAEMSLSLMAPSCFGMSSYRTIWTNSKQRSVVFIKLKIRISEFLFPKYRRPLCGLVVGTGGG